MNKKFPYLNINIRSKYMHKYTQCAFKFHLIFTLLKLSFNVNFLRKKLFFMARVKLDSVVLVKRN